MFVYAGSYTDASNSKGVYQFSFNCNTGELTFHSSFDMGPNPSYLLFTPDWLYAALETDENAKIAASKRNHLENSFDLPIRKHSEGKETCQIALSPDKKHILSANYGSGSISSYKLDSSGAPTSGSALLSHIGRSIHPKRQTDPHIHSIIFEPAHRFFLALDLGIDKIHLYQFSNENSLIPYPDQPEISLPAGCGPRYFTFHPSGKFGVLVAELSNQIWLYEFSKDQKNLEVRNVFSTLPKGYTGKNLAADLHFSPDGKFLYVSNRGHNSIALYQVLLDKPDLKLIGRFPCGGDWPRSFALFEKWLIVANQYSSDLTVFLRDPATGSLSAPLFQAEVPNVSFVTFDLYS